MGYLCVFVFILPEKNLKQSLKTENSALEGMSNHETELSLPQNTGRNSTNVLAYVCFEAEEDVKNIQKPFFAAESKRGGYR